MYEDKDNNENLDLRKEPGCLAAILLAALILVGYLLFKAFTDPNSTPL